MCVFNFVITIITTNVIPRVSHRQAIKSKFVFFLSGLSFKDGLNLIVKSPGLFVPLFSLFNEEM